MRDREAEPSSVTVVGGAAWGISPSRRLEDEKDGKPSAPARDELDHGEAEELVGENEFPSAPEGCVETLVVFGAWLRSWRPDRSGMDLGGAAVDIARFETPGFSIEEVLVN